MARKKKTTRAVARDTVTLNSVFTGIADAIRAKGVSGTMTPAQMPAKIASISEATPEFSGDSTTLEGVFQNMATAIRSCGVEGSMTAIQMPDKISQIFSEATTKALYLDESRSETNIVGSISGEQNVPTTQIPNLANATELEIGTNVTAVGNYAFYNCSNLASIQFPSSVSSIGTYAFYGCTGLSEVEIPDTVTGTLSMYAFYGCSNMVSITIGSGITELGVQALRNCTSLETVNITGQITGISTACFSGCSSLTQISLPSSLTTLGNGAFMGCSGLTEIKIPSGVSTIPAQVFNSCTGIEDYDFSEYTSIPTLNSVNAFTNTSSTKKIYVPDDLYDQWIVANNWSDSTIQPYIYKASVKTTWNITYTLNNANATAPAKTTYTPADLPYTPANLATTTKKPLYTESGASWTKRVARVMTFKSWTPASIPVGTTGDVGFSASWNTKYTFNSPDSGASTNSQMYLFNRIPAGNYKLAVNGLSLEHTKNTGGAQDVIVMVKISTSSNSDLTPTEAANFTGDVPTDKSKTINGTGYYCGCFYFTKGQATTTKSFSLKNIPIEITSTYSNCKISLTLVESPVTSETHSTLFHQGSSTTATLTKV